MRGRIFISAAARRCRGFFDDGRLPQQRAVFGLFLLGTLIGAAAGCFLVQQSGTGELSDTAAGLLSGSFLESAYKAFFYIGLALIFSTSYLGIFLLPALVLVRAYTFSCSIASLGAAFGERGLLYAALALGVPGLLSVPAFLLCACVGMENSKLLCSLRFSGAFPGARGRISHWQSFFIAAASVGVLIYDHFILPLLLA